VAKKSAEASPAPDETSPAAATEKKGKATPKRPKQGKARPPAQPPMTAKEARKQRKTQQVSKEQRKEAKAALRAERARIAEGQWKGDPLYDKYHLPRDRGPERLLARDIVDSRRTVGQYFFFFAMGLIILSGPVLAANPAAAVWVNLVWLAMVLAFIVDSVFLCRRTKRLVWERFPKTEQRKGGLYWYVISRSLMFRSMRQPRPRMSYRATDADLGQIVRD
jgi:hypothetical protein